jgi:CBS domain-containing protein/uncharacterized protein (DUF2267 family)
MSLERFRRPRMVVLKPQSTAHEAARAMADNCIGAVLVSGDHHVAGIVTDRDLALKVACNDKSSRATRLRDVMTDDVCTIDVKASVDDVIRLMRNHGCRRVPVTEQGKLVGIVSLDDLILEGAIEPREAAAIVGAQLRAAHGSLKAEGATHPETPARPELAASRAGRALLRRRARADVAYAKVLHAVQLRAGLEHRGDAEKAMFIVLGAVCRRITPDQAGHFLAQLPSQLQAELDRVLQGPDRRITRKAIESELAREMHVDSMQSAAITEGVGNAIAQNISAGEVQSLRGQLPAQLRELFPPPSSAAGSMRPTNGRSASSG